jgi:hypothetical protein
MEALQIVITTICSIIGTTGVFTLFPGYLIQNLFAKDLEKCKAELKSTSDKEIAEINAYLRVQAFQHEKSFAILQEKRALVIEEMYEKLVNYINSAESFVNPMQWAGEESKEVKAEKTKKAADDFQQFYRTKKVYFDEEFCKKMDVIDEKTLDAVNDYITYSKLNDYERNRVDNGDAKKTHENYKAMKKCHETIVNILLKDIESEFRKIIGVN